MSWLREQSLVTFRRHHPDWEVYIGSPEPPARPLPAGVQWLPDDVTRDGLPPAARSDWWRYHVLAKLGGFYADTDVLFTRNVEPLFDGDYDAWLTLDGGTYYPGAKWTYQGPALGKRPSGVSIGVLAAHPARGDARFFLRAADWCEWTHDATDYQSHGTRLLVAHWEELAAGSRLGSIPFRAFYRGSSAPDVRAIWQPGRIEPREYGVHWYGGSPESRPYEWVRCADDLPESAVRRALS
jgi:hypothetical protein